MARMIRYFTWADLGDTAISQDMLRRWVERADLEEAISLASATFQGFREVEGEPIPEGLEWIYDQPFTLTDPETRRQREEEMARFRVAEKLRLDRKGEKPHVLTRGTTVVRQGSFNELLAHLRERYGIQGEYDVEHRDRVNDALKRKSADVRMKKLKYVQESGYEFRLDP